MNAPRIRPSQRLPLCSFVYYSRLSSKAGNYLRALFIRSNCSKSAKVTGKLLQKLHQLMR